MQSGSRRLPFFLDHQIGRYVVAKRFRRTHNRPGPLLFAISVNGIFSKLI